tara:strand:+ start:1402 stop:2412 length:1011 start_codon:yes stop_codon:yes gene_type:complete
MDFTLKKMKYIHIEKHGAPDVLKLKTKSVPLPGPDQVLIRVAAAGVNRPDIMQRKGLYTPPVGANNVLGLEVSGTVVRVGENISEDLINSEVCALVTCGGYAEYCLASLPLCLPIPRNVSLIEASGIPETFFTVWSNVFDMGKLRKGNSFLVHGGSSGIGTTAIQLGKAFGAIVFTTAGTNEKCKFCNTIGADVAINYHKKNFFEEIHNLTDGKGVDFILDMVGGTYISQNIKSLAKDGKLIQIALMEGHKIEIDFLELLLKRLTIISSTLRARSIEQKSEIANSLKKKVWPLFENGIVRPIIYKVFPLELAEEAHILMESSKHIGKILLEINSKE